MKFFLICAAGLLIISAAACAKSEAPTSTGGGTATTMAPATMAAAPTAMGGKMAMAKTVSVTMNAQNGSGETGTAMLTAKGANTLVVITLKGQPAEAKQPAHIHPGSCAKLNPIPKYPLSDVYDGKSTTTVKQTLSDLDTGHWAINVHASAANLTKYVSCGDIPVAAGHM